MQCFFLLAFMLAYLAEVDNQLCLLQQGSGRMLGTVKMPVQLCLHPQRGMKPVAAVSGRPCAIFRGRQSPGTGKNSLVRAKPFGGPWLTCNCLGALTLCGPCCELPLAWLCCVRSSPCGVSSWIWVGLFLWCLACVCMSSHTYYKNMLF